MCWTWRKPCQIESHIGSVLRIVQRRVADCEDAVAIAAHIGRGVIVRVRLPESSHEMVNKHKPGVRSPHKSHLGRTARPDHARRQLSHGYAPVIGHILYSARVVRFIEAVFWKNREAVVASPYKRFSVTGGIGA